MASITIDKKACKGCSLCVRACPKDVIAISTTESNNAGYFVAIPIALDKCIGCAFCATVCPDVCITVER